VNVPEIDFAFAARVLRKPGLNLLYFWLKTFQKFASLTMNTSNRHNHKNNHKTHRMVLGTCLIYVIKYVY